MPRLKILSLFTIILFLTLKTAASDPGLEAARLLEAEQELSNLGYWVLNVDGKPDASTTHAITAFQKVEGLKRTGKLTPDVLEALRFASRPASQFNTGAAHVEVDMKRQVLFYIGDSGNIERILPVSTGSEQKYFFEGKWDVAHTPRGTFKIYGKLDEVRHAPLGDIYYPSYFYGGVAIHGSNSIPVFAASHGCVRIPRYADQAFGHMTRVGMEVYVYDNNFLTRAPGESREYARTSWFTRPATNLFANRGSFGGRPFETGPLTAGLYDQSWKYGSIEPFRSVAPANSYTRSVYDLFGNSGHVAISDFKTDAPLGTAVSGNLTRRNNNAG